MIYFSKRLRRDYAIASRGKFDLDEQEKDSIARGQNNFLEIRRIHPRLAVISQRLFCVKYEQCVELTAQGLHKSCTEGSELASASGQMNSRLLVEEGKFLSIDFANISLKLDCQLSVHRLYSNY